LPCRISKGSHLKTDRNFAFVSQLDRACPHAHPTYLPPEIMARDPLLGPSTGAHKTLIYNI
jgi:hypothetical protein